MKNQVAIKGEWNRDGVSARIKVYEAEKMGLGLKLGKLLTETDEFVVGSQIWDNEDLTGAKSLFESQNNEVEVLSFNID
jgi:hypothetical protein